MPILAPADQPCRSIVIALLVAIALPMSQLWCQTGSIAGRTIDAQSKTPVANADVLLDRRSVSVLSDENGRFAYHDLTPGRHTIHIRIIGYAPIAQEITITSGETLEPVFQMNPVPVPVAGIVVAAHKDTLRWAPLASARLGAGIHALVGRDAERLMRFAKALAGTTLGEDRLYVDGLPASRLPAAQTIAGLA
ncbi:MAG: carboxypeptidase regulatory-like domain-containing protein, partial [Gemmatimonadota bacterium]